MSELEKLIDASKLKNEVKRLLQFEIAKMRMIIANEKSFKESKIWDQYQKMTAQLVAVAIDLDEGDRKKLKPMLYRLAGRVREGIGLAADFAQLGDASSKIGLLE